jgi:hypothetical protein
VAEEAHAWLKKKPAPTKGEAIATLKKPPVYPTAAVASAEPSGDGGGDDDSTDKDDHLPFPVNDDDDDNLNKNRQQKWIILMTQ